MAGRARSYPPTQGADVEAGDDGLGPLGHGVVGGIGESKLDAELHFLCWVLWFGKKAVPDEFRVTPSQGLPFGIQAVPSDGDSGHGCRAG